MVVSGSVEDATLVGVVGTGGAWGTSKRCDGVVRLGGAFDQGEFDEDFEGVIERRLPMGRITGFDGGVAG